MTQPLSPASLVLSLPVEAWVERHGDDLVIRWTPDAPLLALYAGSAPDGMGGVPLPTTIDATGKSAVVKGVGGGRTYFLSLIHI